MSRLMELEDFEFSSDMSGIDLKYYAIYFFYIIEWAYSRKFLADELENDDSFISYIEKVRNKEIDCLDFLSEQLDFQLSTNDFKDPIIKDFIYIYGGIDYEPHLQKNMWEREEGGGVQSDLITNVYKSKESERLMKDIDSSFKTFLEINYKDNLNDYYPLKFNR